MCVCVVRTLSSVSLKYLLGFTSVPLISPLPRTAESLTAVPWQRGSGFVCSLLWLRVNPHSAPTGLYLQDVLDKKLGLEMKFEMWLAYEGNTIKI